VSRIIMTAITRLWHAVTVSTGHATARCYEIRTETNVKEFVIVMCPNDCPSRQGICYEFRTLTQDNKAVRSAAELSDRDKNVIKLPFTRATRPVALRTRATERLSNFYTPQDAELGKSGSHELRTLTSESGDFSFAASEKNEWSISESELRRAFGYIFEKEDQATSFRTRSSHKEATLPERKQPGSVSGGITPQGSKGV
jgi:hypothetical protein